MSEDPTQVHQLVTALARRHGWTTRAAISRNTGVAETTLARWEEGKGGRGDAFARAEEALALPEGTLGRVLVGELDVEDVLAVRDHQTATDYRSGGTTPDRDLANDARQHLARIRADHVEFATQQLEPLGDVEAGGPADLVLHRDGVEYVVEVKSSRPADEDEVVRDVGRAAELSAEGRRLLVFALVDWPDEAVERIKRLGGIYATPATVGEALTAEGKG